MPVSKLCYLLASEKLQVANKTNNTVLTNYSIPEKSEGQLSDICKKDIYLVHVSLADVFSDHLHTV